MEYIYTGLASKINEITDQFDKENITWNYPETNQEPGVVIIKCDIEPKEMLNYLDNAMQLPTRILPIPKKIVRANSVDDILLAHNCDIAYIRKDENDTKILDSEELYPNKFTNEYYKEKFEKDLEEMEKKHSSNEDIIHILETTLETLTDITTAKTKDDFLFFLDSSKDDIKSAIRRLKYQSETKNN